MIGKPIKGRSFGGCVRYVVNKKEAAILEAEGVRMQDAASITRDFNFQRVLNPDIGKAVGHTVLSWSEQDKAMLNDELMIEIGQKYMQAMGIINTQYLIVKHQDKDHPHVHILFNRVNNEGKTITDQNDYARNAKVCRQLTEAYGLHIANGKDEVKRQQLKGSDKIRYEIYDALKQALPTARTWLQLDEGLKQKGISILFKYKSGTDEVQGVSFAKNGITFKGSAIDRSMSLAGIEKQLWQNQRNSQRLTIALQSDTNSNTAPEKEHEIDTGIQLAASVTQALAGWLQSVLKAEGSTISGAPIPDPKKKKKKIRR